MGGPIKKDRVLFFGGYQHTEADTGFVPTAQSLAHLPDALNLISGERTAENLFQAFRATNPKFTLTDPSQIDPLAVKLFNLRNPETGDFVIGAPAGRPFTGSRRVDATGNPLSLVRQVFPARFEQDQFNLKSDVQISSLNRLSASIFFADYPGFDPFQDPSSLASPFTLEREDQARTLSVTDIHTFGPTVTNEARFGFHLLDNSRLLDPKFDSLTNEAVGVPNPATQFDDSIATRRLGHYVFRGPRFSFWRAQRHLQPARSAVVQPVRHGFGVPGQA